MKSKVLRAEGEKTEITLRRRPYCRSYLSLLYLIFQEDIRKFMEIKARFYKNSF